MASIQNLKDSGRGAWLLDTLEAEVKALGTSILAAIDFDEDVEAGQVRTAVAATPLGIVELVQSTTRHPPVSESGLAASFVPWAEVRPTLTARGIVDRQQNHTLVWTLTMSNPALPLEFAKEGPNDSDRDRLTSTRNAEFAQHVLRRVHQPE